MQATLTELHRATRKVIQPAIHGKEKVTLTEFGQPCAEIRPLSEKRIVSEDDLRASQVSDEAILAALSEARE
jgi:antitoxin (DNA-binding transcriptional repressor) of toxin-antitoxin stability system